MRDKYSHEIARSLYPYGFYKKFTDAGYRNPSKKQMATQENPGLADGIFLSAYGENRFAFVETKTGKDRFDFDGWVQKQREFAIACYWTGYPYWIFLVMGTAVNAVTKPRVSYLIPGLQLALIVDASSRKSLNYMDAESYYRDYQLPWAGNSTWEIPDQHAFYRQVILGTDHADVTRYRHRALRRRRSGER